MSPEDQWLMDHAAVTLMDDALEHLGINPTTLLKRERALGVRCLRRKGPKPPIRITGLAALAYCQAWSPPFEHTEELEV